MPTYDCNENQFVENIRRLLRLRVKFIVNRIVSQYDDGKYSLGHLPEKEFERYLLIATRTKQRSTVYAKKHFFDEGHQKLITEGEILHTINRTSRPNMKIPYYKVTYTFTLWGETYRYEFNVLFKPEIKIEKKKIRKAMRNRIQESGTKIKSEPMLMYILNFIPPKEEALNISLPPSVITFDVTRKYRNY